MINQADRVLCINGSIINEVKQDHDTRVLPLKYEKEEGKSNITALGGLPAYLDLAQVMGLSKSIEQHIGIRSGGHG